MHDAMRTATVLALLILATPGRIDAQTPDPIDPARYYPLAVGDVWEYRVELGVSPGFDARYEILRDTLIDGRRYLIESQTTRQAGGPFSTPFETPMRYDPVTQRVHLWTTQDAPFYPRVCSFGFPFGPNQTCQQGPRDIGGGLGGVVTLGDSSRVAVSAQKRFGSQTLDAYIDTYAADIGLISRRDNVEGGDMRLHYARIGGVEYGTPLVVSGEAVPAEAEVLTLRTRGQRLVVAARGPVRVELFDTLGRRVAMLHDGGLDGERAFDLPALPAGLYIARALQGTARASVRVVVAR